MKSKLNLKGGVPDSLSKIITYDIETSTITSSFDELNPTQKEDWAKVYQRKVKQEDKMFINPYGQIMSMEEAYSQSGAVFRMFNKIVSIAYSYFKLDKEESTPETKVYRATSKIIATENEDEILESIYKMFSFHQRQTPKGTYPDKYYYGFNNFMFDDVVIFQRGMLKGILPDVLCKTGIPPWEARVLDVLNIFRNGSYSFYTSLDLICNYLGVESPKEGEVKGSQVSKCFWGIGEWGEKTLEERLSMIGEYNARDTEALLKVLAVVFKTIRRPDYDIIIK